MKTPYPITKTHRQLLLEGSQRVQQAQQQLNTIYTLVLAAHDVTTGQVVAVDDTNIWVETPEADPGEGVTS